MGKLYTILTDDRVLRALLVGSFIVVDSWKLYLIFRNIMMLRDLPDALPELTINSALYDKMQTITQFESERHLLITIIELNFKVVKLVCNYFQYIWMLTKDYDIVYLDPLVGRAMMFSAADNCLEVAVAIPMVFLSSLLTGMGNPLLLVLDQTLDMAFRAIIASLGTYGIIYVTDRYGVASILTINLVMNGLGVIFMAIFYKCLMSYNYGRLQDNETGKSILELAKEVGYPAEAIYVDKSAPEPNAYYSSAIFTSTVIITEPLLKILEAPQATSVVAHELGHWAYLHPMYTYLGQTIEIVAMGSLFIISYGSSKLIRVFQLDPDVHPFIPVYTAFYFIWPTFRQVFQGVFNVFKTNCEYVADEYACRLRGAKHLRQALVDISLKLNSFPLLDSWFTAWFVGHPSIIQRIRKIEDKGID